MVNQICIAGLVQGLSEGLHFAQKAGLDGEAVLEVISKGGAAGSWQMENRGKTMLADKFDFGFAVDWMRKDLGDLPRGGERNGASCRSPRWSTSSTRTSRRWAAGAGTPRR
jgi:3-hydroxyisobutyrate dehydrogenase